MWLNMVAVITQVSYTEDFDEMEEWIELMEKWKSNLTEELCKRYEGAEPTVLAISQDRTKPKRPENKEDTEPYELMQQQMDLVYSKGYQKFQKNEHFDLSNLQYIMAPETYAKWLESKSCCKKIYNEQLAGVLNKDHVKAMFMEILQSCHKSMEDKGDSFTYKSNYM